MAKRGKTVDYRNAYIPGKEKPPKAKAELGPGEGKAWWLEDDEAALNTISADLDFWATRQRWRINQLMRYMRMYGNMPSMGMSSGTTAIQQAFRSTYGEVVTYPVSTSGTDTLVSKITRNKPLPYYLTDNGDHRAQRKAKNRNIFTMGSFHENKTYEKARLAFRDGLIVGDGLIYVHDVEGRSTHDKVMSFELFVDELEAAATNGNPRQIHMIKFHDRSTLKRQHPDKADLIDEDQWAQSYQYAYSESLADLVCVRTSWHLPSYDGADDGKVVVSLGSGMLEDPKPYKFNRFPFARMSYAPRPVGFWSQGLIEQGEGIQLELNRVAYRIQQNNIRAGEFKLWVKNGGGVSIDQLTNDIAAVIQSDEKPEEILIEPVPESTYQYVEDLWRRWYQIPGISLSDATSTRPPGEQSGTAIRLTHDLGTERFASLAQRYEEFVADIAHLDIMVTQQIVEDQKQRVKDGEKPSPYTVNAFVRGSRKVVSFDDLGFEPGEVYCIKSYPVSTLPWDPAGREEEIIERVQAGWLDPDMGRYLSDFPDTGRIEGLHNAQREFIMATLDAMVEKGADYTPDPYDNVPMFLELAMEYYSKYKMPEAGVPAKRLGLLRNLIDVCRKMSAPPPMPVTPGPAPGPLPGATPQAKPGPLPVSPALPFKQ